MRKSFFSFRQFSLVSATLLMVLILFSAVPSAYAGGQEAPEVEWEKTFGVDGMGACVFWNFVQQIKDGGYIIVSSNGTYGAGDVYLIKTDDKGNQQWYKTFGGSGDDEGRCIQHTADGGYIIVGSSSGNVYLIKLYANGDTEWESFLPDPVSDGCGNFVQQTTDGGYIIVGTTGWIPDRHILLIKTDASGHEQWRKMFSLGSYCRGFWGQQTTDGGYIIVGDTVGDPDYSFDIYLIKTNANGDLEWQKKFGGPYQEQGVFVLQTTDGGYIISGFTCSFGVGGSDVWLIKTDADGNTEWDKTLGGSGIDVGHCIQQTKDEGYIIAGCTNSFDAGSWKVYLVKLKGKNQPPVADANGPYVGSESSPITFDGSGSYDPDGEIVLYEWDLDGDGEYDDATGVNPSYTWYDDYSGTIGLRVTDDGGLTDTDTASVTVNNVPPTANIDSFSYPEFVIFVGDEVSFTGSFTDPGILDTHTIQWDFGDGTVVTCTLTPTHAYMEPGDYKVTLTVTDDDGGVGTDTVQLVVKTQEEATQTLITIIEEMNLSEGIEDSLTSILDNLIASLERVRDNAAESMLNAFINYVKAIPQSKITSEQAEELIKAAQAIIDHIE